MPAENVYLAVKFAGREYKVEHLTLGELWDLEQHFGIEDAGNIFNVASPRVLAAIVYLTLKREQPDLSHEAALEQARDIDFFSVEAPGVKEKRPTRRKATKPQDAPVAAGDPETTPEEPGTPS